MKNCLMLIVNVNVSRYAEKLRKVWGYFEKLTLKAVYQFWAHHNLGTQNLYVKIFSFVGSKFII